MKQTPAPAPTATTPVPAPTATTPVPVPTPTRNPNLLGRVLGSLTLVGTVMLTGEASADVFGGITGFMGEIKSGLSGPVAKGVAGLMLASGAVSLIAGNKQAFTTILWAAAGMGAVGVIVGLAG